ncbi:ABC transporter substrate-binding protein [Staphylococcus equorum]|uniref:ABC transporter substrate-binding protein n=1 Tax=Staphylococcus equorum TaxID=246432 RepID=UPI000852D656|nr:ABC transporter substrate-binding protein [Staphylococcus equorum]MDK9858716.1 ABC transporter substrate-binding protein [Staphylococcus equorum]MDK9875776.1 ABC transporter substrate-binding protein [Staphylococcus equorum]OEK53155.1 ferrichrome ABC transporter substrate-binding protein [Staphylococcus equorum]
MKKFIIFIILVVLLAGACSNDSKTKGNESTRSYTLDGGNKIDIPKHPKRIAVVANTYAGGLKYLGGNIVGVTKDIEKSNVLKDKFKDTTKLSENDVEKVAKLKPDLIIVDTTDKNIKKYQKIAATIPIEYGKKDYLETQVALGEILGKKKEAEKWVEKWKTQTANDSKEIKQHIGNNSTVSIFDDFSKTIYAFGKSWGRGGEVVYQAFGLDMPPALEKAVDKEGYKELSMEKLPQYSGDYIITMSEGKSKPEFEKSHMWQNIPAVKNDNVINVKAETYWYNDPYSLEYIRKELKNSLMK